MQKESTSHAITSVALQTETFEKEGDHPIFVVSFACASFPPKSQRSMDTTTVRLCKIIYFILCLTIRTQFLFFRSLTWWNNIVLETFSERDWIENFRVSKNTFNFLCSKLRRHIERQNTHLRRAICVEHRVAITLWCLATCAEYRTIGHLFGVARCTVCVIVHDTCKAIVKVLLSTYIKFPKGEHLRKVVEGFKDKWGMIQCAGAIDGCHIPVLPPALNHTDFYNRKGWYSMVLQAVVDDNYLFTDVYVGWPGSVHDARVLANSSIYKKAETQQILTGDVVVHQEMSIPIFLVGDSAYPLSTWLMKPFAHNSNLTPSQRSFNFHLSRARIVVENSFGRLKARWRRLMKRNDMNVDNVPCVVTACCILHNMCEVHGDTFNELWMEEVNNSAQSQPAVTVGDRNAHPNARAVRDALVHYYQ